MLKTLKIINRSLNNSKLSSFLTLKRTVYRSVYDHSDKIAVIDDNGRYSYKNLISASFQLSNKLLKSIPSGKLKGERIAFLCNQDVSYVLAQWSCWLNHSVCVPLCKDHPAKVLEYYIKDSKASILISTSNFENVLKPLAEKFKIPLIVLNKDDLKMKNDKIEKDLDIFSNSKEDALILYTSGTTGPPKGVVHTVSSLKAQMDAMIESWRWETKDTLLNVLPLHHVHGIVNCVMTPLYNGSTLVMDQKFDAATTWNHLLNDKDPSISVFMAVPTIYVKLIEQYKKSGWTSKDVEQIRKMRLFVSEQFGMSEAGRVLSNTIDGKKLPGRVGLPMPNMTIRLTQKDDNNNEKIVAEGTLEKVKIFEKGDHKDGNVSGELHVKGDMVEYEMANNTFKIMGRTSVDIIKSGGYKISALDIEAVLLHHPSISECVVLGVPDAQWGEKVTAIIVLNQNAEKLSLDQIREYCKKKLPAYSCPTNLKIVDAFERNAVGKINKKELRQKLFPTSK
ncbi:unnamed protein product [Didymodactylos carnosus]|uniref:Uncharacterized protein n=1 Tax=Didymodactylos carnosus TaxID=1234261 RepID=A0A813YFA5_9BILA|nr:unnamed protein product [Didymodactylos carnosus]CAF3669190.1 unnamed protein product [Didymodactylos carnosus]